MSAHHDQTAASPQSDSDTQRRLKQKKQYPSSSTSVLPHGRLRARRHRLVPGRARRRAALDRQAPPARRAIQARRERTHLRTHQPGPCPAVHRSAGPRCAGQHEAGRTAQMMGNASRCCSLQCAAKCRSASKRARPVPQAAGARLLEVDAAHARAGQDGLRQILLPVALARERRMRSHRPATPACTMSGQVCATS